MQRNIHSHNIEIKDTAPQLTGDVMHSERQACEEQLHFKKLEPGWRYILCPLGHEGNSSYLGQASIGRDLSGIELQE